MVFAHTEKACSGDKSAAASMSFTSDMPSHCPDVAQWPSFPKQHHHILCRGVLKGSEATFKLESHFKCLAYDMHTPYPSYRSWLKSWGLVNFIPAVAYYFCLNLPATFSKLFQYLAYEMLPAMHLLSFMFVWYWKCIFFTVCPHLPFLLLLSLF